MKHSILIFLYLFYAGYRFIYWGAEDLLSVSLNAISDTIVAYLCGRLVYVKAEQLFKHGKNVSAYIQSIFLFILACSLLWCLHWLVYDVLGELTTPFKQSFWSLTFQFFDVFTLLLVGTSATYAWLKNREVRLKEKQLQQLKEEKTAAELKFLKSQINPHFIFNTLNAIYFSINKENEQARTLINNFADLFRFQLYESDQDYILLQKELEFIKKYIEIHQIRLQETHDIYFEVDGDVSQERIPPLLLIPLIENAFKHASSKLNQKSIIDIRIQLKVDNLNFIAKNTKEKQDANTKGGVGLENVKKRLQILYAEEYQMEIKETESEFEIRLEIPLMR